MRNNTDFSINLWVLSVGKFWFKYFRVGQPNCIAILVQKFQYFRSSGKFYSLIHYNILVFDLLVYMTCKKSVKPPKGGVIITKNIFQRLPVLFPYISNYACSPLITLSLSVLYLYCVHFIINTKSGLFQFTVTLVSLMMPSVTFELDFILHINQTLQPSKSNPEINPGSTVNIFLVWVIILFLYDNHWCQSIWLY